MTLAKLLGAPALAAFLVMIVGCSSPHQGLRGHLVMVGGGLKRDNDLIYGSFKSSADLSGKAAPKAAVIPLASGEPEKSGPDWKGDFDKGFGPDNVSIVPLTKDNPQDAGKPEIVTQIKGSDFVFFTGGDQSRILGALRPAEGDTPAYHAVLEVLQEGGTVAGTSAGAAMMSDPMLRWGDSESALLLGETDVEDYGVGLGKGMGLFPFGLVDQHFLARGRYGRLITALDRTSNRYGFGIDENSAIVVDRAKRRIEVLGDHAVLFIDMKGARHENGGFQDIHISLLSTGDVVRDGVVAPEGSRTRFAITKFAAERASLDDPWGPRRLPDAMIAMADMALPRQVLEDEVLRVTLSCEQARFFQTRQGDRTTWTLVNYTLGVERKPGSDKREAELRAKAEASRKK